MFSSRFSSLLRTGGIQSFRRLSQGSVTKESAESAAKKAFEQRFPYGTGIHEFDNSRPFYLVFLDPRLLVTIAPTIAIFTIMYISAKSENPPPEWYPPSREHGYYPIPQHHHHDSHDSHDSNNHSHNHSH
eukprot:c7124_g1_i1.p1 GENE.c7124_g1_i1~~c7124_g1_i1.p1  ORF type:complete len:137 (+),score=40.33 c7124_g1_i1:23-412(+)